MIRDRQSRPSGPAGKVVLIISIIEIMDMPLVCLRRIRSLMARIIRQQRSFCKSTERQPPKMLM